MPDCTLFETTLETRDSRLEKTRVASEKDDSSQANNANGEEQDSVVTSHNLELPAL